MNPSLGSKLDLICKSLKERSMSWNGSPLGSLIVLACVLVALPARADDAATRERDEQAIRATAKAYMAALAKGDAKAISEYWTTDADFIDDLGNAHPASELAADVRPTTGKGAKDGAKVAPSRIRFLTDDVAIEDGASDGESPDAKGAANARGHFHAVWVKQKDRWRLASLCEIPIEETTEQRIADLGWMVGTWIAESGHSRLEVSVQWNATQTYLLRDIKAIDDGKVGLRGSGRIGWDPLTRNLKSWSFDSKGGYDKTTWTKNGNSWVGQASGVLADGRQTSATTVITHDGNDSYTRKVLAGRIQGEPIPDQEVRFTRQAASPR
jgi:uncharacterized protein (TIGR02246 family)